MFQRTKLCIWKEHAPVATCFGMLHPFSSHQLIPATFLPVTFWNWTSEEIQSILAMPLIINWSRPNNYGKGNKGKKTDQDTMSPSALCCHRHHLHHLSWPCTVLKLQTHFYTPHLFPAGWMPATGQNWGPPKLLPKPFLLEVLDCFGAQGESWKILISSSRG